MQITFSLQSWIEVFIKTPAGELVEAILPCERLCCSKQLLNHITFIWFSDRKLFTLATLKNSEDNHIYTYILYYYYCALTACAHEDMNGLTANISDLYKQSFIVKSVFDFI